MTTGASPQVLLSANGLSLTYAFGKRRVRAVSDVSVRLERGETLAIIGESGSGKSTLGRILIRALEPEEGRLHVLGKDYAHARGRELAPLRKHMQMVFQDPYASLDPRWTIARIVAEPLVAQRSCSRAEVATRVRELLHEVGLPADVLTRLPRSLSGGQRQRVAIARALAPRPDILIADEPVSALDVSVQAQIVRLLANLRERFELSQIVISHDLALVNRLADRVMVMYLGRVVETGPTRQVVHRPRHPFTRALRAAVPALVREREEEAAATSSAPSSAAATSGCAYADRCARARTICREQMPLLDEQSPHRAACHFPD